LFREKNDMILNHTLKPEDLKGRTCATCACVYVIEPPKVPTAQQLAADPNVMNITRQYICRLNPPTLVLVKGISPEGTQVQMQKLMQQPTEPYISCWNWRKPGTLPGDAELEVEFT